MCTKIIKKNTLKTVVHGEGVVNRIQMRI